jgi:vacuolar-type H+-ATPase subunit H
VEIHKKLDELIDLVESARTMPMSSSAILNKTEVLALVKQVRDMLPNSLAAADTVIEQREELLEEARNNASRMISDARAEQARLVGDHTVLVEARRERGRTLEQTRQEIEAMRVALDDHVDAKLAHVELVAERIVATVKEGRDQLRRSGPFDELVGADSETGAAVGATDLLRHAVDTPSPALDGPASDPAAQPGAQAGGTAESAALEEAWPGLGGDDGPGLGSETTGSTWIEDGGGTAQEGAPADIGARTEDANRDDASPEDPNPDDDADPGRTSP